MTIATTTQYLAQYGITLQDANNFITSNINNLILIFNTAKQYGITTTMLGDIVGVSESTVSAYLQQNGFNPALLDTPSVISSSYNAATGILTLTGFNFTPTAGDYNPAKLTLSGDGGVGYSLTSGSALSANPVTGTVIIQLSSTDQLAVDGLLNKTGATAVSGASYNVTAGSNWDSSTSYTNSAAVAVSNPLTPTLNSINYNDAYGLLTLTGSNLVNHGNNNGLVLTDLTLTGQGGKSYTLTGTGDTLGTLTAGGVTITLQGSDLQNVSALLNNDGTQSSDATPYNLTGVAGWDSNLGAATNQGISVTGAAAQNQLSQFGISAQQEDNYIMANLNNLAAVFSSARQDGLTTTMLGEILNVPASTVSAYLQQNGFNPAQLDGPSVTAASYNAAAGKLTMTGFNFTTTVGDYNPTKLTLSGDGGASYTLTSGSTLSGTPSSGTVIVQLSSSDQLAVDGLLNKTGAMAVSGATYNLNASGGWDGSASSTTNAAVTVSNPLTPTLTSINYNDAYGVLTLTGSNLVNHGGNNGLVITDLTLTGQGGKSYTLTGTGDTLSTLTSSGVTVTLQGNDLKNVSALLNNDGAQSSDATPYSLTSSAGWDSNLGAAASQSISVTGAAAVNQLNQFGISIQQEYNYITANLNNLAPVFSSARQEGLTTTMIGEILNVPESVVAADFQQQGFNPTQLDGPSVLTANYNASAGTLNLSGWNFTTASSGYAPANLTLSGDGKTSYTLTSGSAVTGTPTSSNVTIQLSTSDQSAINGLLNNNGIQANDASKYNLSAASNWDTGAAAIAVQPITVSNVSAPTITGVTYKVDSGVFQVTGSNLVNHGSSNGIVLSDFVVSSSGFGYTPRLSASDSVTNLSATGFTITLSSADQAAVNSLFPQNSNNSSNSAYYLSTSPGWDSDSGAASSNLVAVSNNPIISSVNYNVITGTFTVSGSNLTINQGNGIVLSDLIVSSTGIGYAPKLSASDSVTNLSASGFTITLSSVDQAAVDSLFTQNGTGNGSANSAYYLSTNAGWDSGAGGVTKNLVTVSNEPIITGVNYNVSTSTFTVTGSNLITGNGIVLSDFIVSSAGFGNRLGVADSVNNLSATGFTITLSSTDQIAVDASYTQNGTSSGNSAYYLTTDAGWDGGAGGAGQNVVTVSNEPVITAVSYNATTGIFSVTGNNLIINQGTGIVLSDFIVSSTGYGNTPRLGAGDTVSNLNTSGFTITLSSADQAAVNLIYPQNSSSSSNITYYLTTNVGWDSGAGGANPNVVTVSGVGSSAPANVFIFNTQPVVGSPVAINNIIEGTGQIELSQAIFTAFFGATTVTTANFSNSANAQSPTDYLYYNASNGGLYYTSNGSSSGSGIEIAVVGVGSVHPTALSSGDFTLIA